MTVPSAKADWWSLAACLSADPELFFPISESGAARQQVTAAKQVCARCPVRQQCLRYALAAGPVNGIWGGTTEQERRMLRERQRAAMAHAARPVAGANRRVRRPIQPAID